VTKTPKPPSIEGFSRGQRLRSVVLRLGVARMALSVGVVSCVASVALSWLMLWAVGASAEIRNVTLPIAAVVPLLVAPAISWCIVGLMHQIEDARTALQEVAIRDGLTRLFNRAHFMDQARGEVARAARYASALSLMIIDADDFKRVNDQHGHQTGDLVLKAIAQTCADNLREHDLLARYGGEEFVVLLPATMGVAAQLVAEKLRAAVERVEITTESKPPVPLRVTVSIGLSHLQNNEHDLDTLFARADAALYESKRGGKNRWTER
jgi:diguanylate cyclase (GGDEF)-like protein